MSRDQEKGKRCAMDLIDRQAAIDALGDIHPLDYNAQAYLDRIKRLPSAWSTLYGYNIEHLDLIARVLQKENLSPERVAEALTDIGRVVEIVRDEFAEALRKAVEQCVI